jgi:sugar phosphate isomerase/epimerase
MELSCALTLLGDRTISDAMTIVRKIGLRNVEIDLLRFPRRHVSEIKPADLIKELCRQYELRISGVYVGEITAERIDQLKLQVKEISNALKTVREMNCNLGIIRGGARTLDNFNFFREGLSQLITEAEKLDLELAVQNHTNTRMENSQDFLGLFSGLSSDRVGVCLDVHHFHLCAVNTDDMIREMSGRIKMVRMCDMMGSAPVMPGQGEIEIKGLVRSLRRERYDGVIAVDHLPDRNEQIESVLDQAVRYFEGIIT